MNRRVFLASLGTLSVAGIAAATSAAAASAAAALPTTLQTGADIQRFKIVGRGRLLVSNDGGHTWQPSINLGPDTTVIGVSREGQHTHLELSFQGHTFALRSTDGITWRTLE